jgi:polyribonucleotide nucleotidyltransferase
MIRIPVEKIGEVIGPGGRVIKKIIEETGAAVDVQDDGTVNISALDKDSVEQALEKIQGLTREVEVGEIFEGEVKRIQPFGAFVEIAPGKEGLVHVSKMSTEFVNNPADVVKIGQKVKVKVREIDDMKRINLTMVFGPEAESGKKLSPKPKTGPRNRKNFRR